jgi:alpha-tubulin suppressor-like RCC1 family protein
VTRIWIVLVALVFALFAACSREATALIVTVRTDFTISAPPDGVQVVLEGPSMEDGGVFDAGTMEPLTLTITPHAGDSMRHVRITVRAIRSGSVVVEQRVETWFVPGATRTVPFLLSQRCAGIVCDSGDATQSQSCDPSDGCRDDLVDPANLPRTTDCSSGLRLCDGRCVDVLNDAMNCGACGTICANGCAAGICGEARIREVSTGAAHACARRENGGVVCWGVNDHGQLGISGSARLPLSPVEGLGNVAQIAAGGRHTCALDDAHNVTCWGANDMRQLATSGGDRASPSAPHSVGPSSSIGAGRDHTCAVQTSGAVLCWGGNMFAALGPATPNADGVATVPGISTARTIAGGQSHTCALLTDGGIRCWGWNANDQLGVTMPPTPPALATPGGLPVTMVAVSLGAFHSCSLAMDGGVWCWGGNGTQQLGDPMRSASTIQPPALTAGPGHAVAIGVGYSHGCAVTQSHEAYCWGQSGDGEVGIGPHSGPLAMPTKVPGLEGVVSIDGGDAFTCAVRTIGDVVCWGKNSSGQLGDGTTISRASPVLVRGLFP